MLSKALTARIPSTPRVNRITVHPCLMERARWDFHKRTTSALRGSRIDLPQLNGLRTG